MFSNYFTIVLIFTATTTICYDDIETEEQQNFHAQLTIFNGDPATVGQIPYFVSIKEPLRKFTENSVLWKNLCGGSIIAVDKVLTAAHCFEVYNYEYLKYPEKLRVVAGSVRNSIIYSGFNTTEVDQQWRPIRKIIIHEDFVFPNNDIALVYVTNWVYSEYINYIIPASVTTDYGRRCQAVGFGMIGHGLSETPSPVLLVTRIYAMDRWKCSLLWNHDMDAFVCTESSESDVTRGDSGGPLVCQSFDDPAQRSGGEVLVGIVSGKSSGKSTLFTRVSAYNHWLGRSLATKSPVDVHLCLMSTLLYAVYGI